MTFGNLNIQDLTFGDKDIVRVNLGDTLIWDRYELETTNYLNQLNIPLDLNSSYITNLSNKDIWDTIDEYIKTLKVANIWQLIKVEYVFLGGTSNYNRYNLKNVTQFTMDWYGSWEHDNYGPIGNGSNTYGDTNFNPQLNQTAQSNGMSLIMRLDYPQDIKAYDVGITSNIVDGSSYFALKSRQGMHVTSMNSGETDYTNNTTVGVYSASRIDNTLTVMKNGVTMVTDSTSGQLPNSSIYLGTVNTIGSGGNPLIPSVKTYSEKQFTGLLLHDGLTPTQMQLLYNAIDVRENKLNRKTW
jgi:hypothetical protein